MAFKSTATRYGTVAVVIHWASVVLILALVMMGFRADSLTDSAAKADILALHVPLGLAVLVLTLIRIAWWILGDQKPTPLPMPRWQDRAARWIHTLFYVVILGMAASGLATVALSGAGPVIFGEVSGALPDFHAYPPRAAHGFGAMVLIGLFVLHAGAALHHHLIKRDGLLKRMWFGAPASSEGETNE